MMFGSGRLGLTSTALMVVALIVVPFASGPASADQDEVPVFVIGQDGGLSPSVIWRDSKEFRDCAVCPALVVIEPGSFLMGPQEDSRCRDEDDPVVEVKIARPFAAGVFEVTVDEWAACLRAGGCSHDPHEWNPGRANRPVTEVSWEDAQQYVRWLSAKTGKRYRLLSEAEWLYLASERKDGLNWYPLLRSSPSPNRFGPHGLAGSVMEWLDDPGTACFTGAPDEGRWNDDLRVLRGPSECHSPRSIFRAWRDPEYREVRDECYGFRVARELGE